MSRFARIGRAGVLDRGRNDDLARALHRDAAEELAVGPGRDVLAHHAVIAERRIERPLA